MATVASGLNSGSGFSNSDTVTSTTLNNHVNDATVTDIGNDDIATNAAIVVTKLADITNNNLVGRVDNANNANVPIVIGGSGDAGVLFDNDDMLDNSDTAGGSATRGATQQSIKAYVDSQAIGVGQSWSDVSSSRSNSTVFQNTTGRPIQVLISHTPDGVTTQSIEVSSDNSTYIQLARIGTDASESGTTFTVPNNHYYKSDGSLTIRTWVELR